MAHFPHYQQPDAMDCGPVCLKIVAKYYGKYFQLDRLRELTYQTREGISLLSLGDAAAKIGLRSRGMRVSLPGLDQLPLPAILHWRQNHFVVLFKISKRKKETVYHLSDPASGLVKCRKEEFLRNWATTSIQDEPAGIVLMLEPTKDFFLEEDEREKRPGLRFLTDRLKPYKKMIVRILLGFLTGSIISLLFPFLTQAIVDVGIGNRDLGFIVLVLLAQLVLIVSQTAVGFIRSWIMLHISARVSIALISDFLIKLVKLPVRFFDSKMTGDLRQRIEDNNRVQSFLTTNLVTMSFGVFMFLIYSVVLVWYSRGIFLIFIVGSTLYILWINWFMKKRKILDDQRFEALAANQSNVYQLITAMQEIKLNNCEERKRWEWEQIQMRLFRVSVKALKLHQNQQAGSVFIHQAKNILIIFLAAKSVLDGSMTLGMLVAVQFIIGQLNAPLHEFISFAATAQDARISLERLGEIHEREEEESLGEGRLTEIAGDSEIRFKNVTFHYEGPRSPKIIDDVTLDIPAGKVTAIVGASGSGKTTLIKLMLGFYPVSEGEILLGNAPLDRYSMQSWRRRCGVVMQEGFIFSDTIAGNISLGDENPDVQKIEHAAEVAGIRDFIESLPLRYNTKVGQEGAGLSQGQKQRILIARAVYRDPLFLFLDEATNSLDAIHERVILNNMEQFSRGKTVVVVAHRLSTVKNADRIVVLDQGRVAESGTHDELAAKKGAYFNLVKNQLELGS